MSRTLFTRLPIVVNDPSLPVIPSADMQSLVEYEIDAYEHWIFDNGASSLVGFKDGKLLTPQSVDPVYSANFATLPSGLGKALLSDMPDTSQRTTIMVIKRPPTIGSGVLLLAGTVKVSSEDTTGASMYFSGNNLLEGNARPLNHTTINMTTGGPDIGEFTFLANSVDGDPTSNLLLYSGGFASNTVSSGTAVSVSNRVIALGNAYYNYANAEGKPDIEVAEFILFQKALSLTELQEVYARSKARLANRGISVF